ncbi:MAG: GreA/GreB family elongation factor [Chloroflexi bacterium]|nr:GreA/GreB family elongation factor [Chloroflexota bacterium]
MSENELLRQVGIGTHVEVELIDDHDQGELMAFDLVKADLGDFDRGLVGANAPLAKAIRGKFVGNVVPYRMGDICRVRIVSVAPLQTSAPTDAAERREAVLKKALDDAERTNAEMFASSFTGKWGGYSVDDSAEWDE